MIIRDWAPPPCAADQETMDLFYSPMEDGRTELGRDDREAVAGTICWQCPYRVQCVQKALAGRESWGVWGGLGEGQRREFKLFLEESMGYQRKDINSLTVDQLRDGLERFYAAGNPNPYQKFYGHDYQAPTPSRGDGP